MSTSICSGRTRRKISLLDTHVLYIHHQRLHQKFEIAAGGLDFQKSLPSSSRYSYVSQILFTFTMASERQAESQAQPLHASPNLGDSSLTIQSDSENYDGNNELSSSAISPQETSSSAGSPVILYSPPTFWSVLRGVAINLVLPFVNGLMLGFGELFAGEIAFRLGWSGSKVCYLRCDVKYNNERQAQLFWRSRHSPHGLKLAYS